MAIVAVSNQDTSRTTSDLAGCLLLIYGGYAQNREEFEAKWDRNRINYKGTQYEDARGTWKKSEKRDEWQSDSVFDVTRQKVSAAVSILRDILLRGYDLAFSINVPKLITAERRVNELGVDIVTDDARQRAEDQEALIKRQMRNCRAEKQIMRCITSGAIYGEFWAKRFIDDASESTLREVYPGDWRERAPETAEETEAIPAFEYKPVWNMFWDMEASDFSTGTGVIERDYVSPYEALQDKGKRYFFDDAIASVIKESVGVSYGNTPPDADTTTLPPYLRDKQSRVRTIRKLECWVRVPRRVAEEFEKSRRKGESEQESSQMTLDAEDLREGDEVEIFAVLMGRWVVAYKRIEITDRPYIRGFWEEELDFDGGVSVADNVEWAQKVLNGAVRCLEDNKKLAGRLITAIKRDAIVGDVVKDLNSDKQAIVIELDEATRSVNDAIQHLVVPDLGPTMMSVISAFLEFADLSSRLPRIQQGMETPTPQTAFEVGQKLERSVKYLSMVLGNFDKFFTEIIKWFYDFNKQDPTLDVGGAEFEIEVLGYATLENRAIRLNRLLATFNLLLTIPDVAAIVDMRWWVRQILEANGIDPTLALKSDERLAAEAAALAEAQARRQQLVEAGAQADVMQKQARAQRDSAGAMAEAERVKTDRAKAVMAMEQMISGEVQA